MKIEGMFYQIESFIKNPTAGLPEKVFLFLSKMTPLINIDLLIKNEQSETLLIWRDDQYYGHGGHVQDGIIRYKESIANRIRKVAMTELSAEVDFKPTPLSINEIIVIRTERGYFISLLYECKLLMPPGEKLKYKDNGNPKNGEWIWHKKYSNNIIKVREISRKFIDETR